MAASGIPTLEDKIGCFLDVGDAVVFSVLFGTALNKRETKS